MGFIVVVLKVVIVLIYLGLGPHPVESSRSLRAAESDGPGSGLVNLIQDFLGRKQSKKPEIERDPTRPDPDLRNSNDLKEILTQLKDAGVILDSNPEHVQISSMGGSFGGNRAACHNLTAQQTSEFPYASLLQDDNCLVLFSGLDCDWNNSTMIRYWLKPGKTSPKPDSPCSEENIFMKEYASRSKKSTTTSHEHGHHANTLPLTTFTSQHPFSISHEDTTSTEADVPDYHLPEMDWDEYGNGHTRTRTTKIPELEYPDTYIEAISDKPISHVENCSVKCAMEDQNGVTHEACAGRPPVRSKCPNGSAGWSSFQCTLNNNGVAEGRFNYSACVSGWISELDALLDSGGGLKASTAANVLNTLEGKLQKSDNGQAKYYGHEIDGLLSLVDQVIGQTDKQNMNETEKLVEASVSIFESLASEPDTWNQLPKAQRAIAATRLFNTIESTMFNLAKANKRSNQSSSSYQRTFNRSKDLKIVVGTMRRSGNPGQEPQVEPDPTAASDLKLPEGWTSLVPGTGDIQFVRMNMGVNLVNNMIPRGDADQTTRSQTSSKSINTDLSSFTVANSNGTVPLKFKGSGIRITFQHAANAWGSDETTHVARKLHNGESPKTVLGSAVCVYWDTLKSNWSSDGCELVESYSSYSVCECKHLTAFAVLMSTHKYTGRDIGLTVLTILLCSLSVIFLITTIIIFKTLHTVRNPRSSVTIHLCACLLVGNILILTLMDRNNFSLPDVVCAFSGMVTHFVFLAAFGWMAVEGYIVYKMVVDVFDSGTENKIRLRLFAYGFPCAIVIGVLVVHLFSANPSYGGDLYCWLEGSYIWSFIVPVFLVTAGNIVILVIALTKAYHKNNSTAQVKQSSKSSRNMIIGTLSLTCLLGITWIFGLLLTTSNAHVSIVGAYLFTLFNASQGIFIFIFHCWMNKQVRKAVDRRISSWTSGSYQTANSRSQQQNSTIYSAAKRTESTRGSKSSSSDKKEVQDTEPVVILPINSSMDMEKCDAQVEESAANMESSDIDSETDVEPYQEFPKGAKQVTITHCSTHV